MTRNTGQDTMRTFHADQIKTIEREVALREETYPTLVKDNEMEKRDAARELRGMRDAKSSSRAFGRIIAAFYKHLNYYNEAVCPLIKQGDNAGARELVEQSTQRFFATIKEEVLGLDLLDGDPVREARYNESEHPQQTNPAESADNPAEKLLHQFLAEGEAIFGVEKWAHEVLPKMLGGYKVDMPGKMTPKMLKHALRRLDTARGKMQQQARGPAHPMNSPEDPRTQSKDYVDRHDFV